MSNSKTNAKSSEHKQENGTKDTDSSSMYRHFMEFVRSPVWTLPVMSFVDQRSLVFEQSVKDEKLYRQIYREFRSMVDTLISSFCEDAHTTPGEFAVLISRSAAGSSKSDDELQLLEPVLAANDYDMFVHMMTRKNIELQLQALKMIEIAFGYVPETFVDEEASAQTRTESKGKKKSENHSDPELLIFMEVMRKSKLEFEKEQRERSKEDADLEKALRESVKDNEFENKKELDLISQVLRLSMSEPVAYMIVEMDGSVSEKDRKAVIQEEEKQSADLQKKPEKTTSGSASKRPPTAQRGRSASGKRKSPEIPVVVPDRAQKSLTASAHEKTAADSKVTMIDTKAALLEAKSDLSPEEVERRKAYLLQQRDRLINMKRDERLKAFSEVESRVKSSRPKSARTARSLLRGRSQPPEKPKEDQLAARKALVQKLKAELRG